MALTKIKTTTLSNSVVTTDKIASNATIGSANNADYLGGVAANQYAYANAITTPSSLQNNGYSVTLSNTGETSFPSDIDIDYPGYVQFKDSNNAVNAFLFYNDTVLGPVLGGSNGVSLAIVEGPEWRFRSNNSLELPGPSLIYTVDNAYGGDGGSITIRPGKGDTGFNDGEFSILTANTHEWIFDNGGNLTVPGNVVSNVSQGSINFTANGSGDGNQFSTLELHPDTSLITDQYIIIDPTSPNHIHIRAGGTQDNSSAIMYFGGETSHLRVNAGQDPALFITSNNYVWEFCTNGEFIVPGNTTIAGNISGNTSGYTIGYLDLPQNYTNTSFTITLSDRGKHIYTSNGTSQTITIANNTNVQFPVGTAISIVVHGAGSVTVARETGVSLYLAANNTDANRTIASYGMATILKVATDTWFINGSGVS